MRDILSVAIFNNVEAFYPYLSHADDPTLFAHMYDKGNRALFWLGDPKLVILSAPAPGLDGHLRQVGYPGTRCLVPREPSPWLCQDVLREPELLAPLLAQPRVQLIPYTTTPQFLALADALRSHGVEVLLPESPAPENLWVRDYLDSKAGFRQLVGAWLGGDALPEGFVCRDVAEAQRAVAWFASRGRQAIVKASRSNGGFGHMAVDSSADNLAANPFFRDETLVVEERIESPGQLFPAIEISVPAAGEPAITHVCTELYLNGKVTGQIVAPELARAPWRPRLAELGLGIAAGLRAMGYAGIFDVDGVIDADGRLSLLEVNTRRTAGTHAHEFACFAFGEDYAGRMAVICHNTLNSGWVSTPDELLRTLDDLLYRAGGPERGIVITHTASLREREFGCLIVAPDTAEATALQDEMLRRIQPQALSSLAQ